MPSLGDSTSSTRWDDKTIALLQIFSRMFSQRGNLRGSQSVDIKSSIKSVRLHLCPGGYSANLICIGHTIEIVPSIFHVEKIFNPVFLKWPGISSNPRSLCGRVQRPPSSIGPSHLQLPDQRILVVPQLFEADQTG